MPRATHALFLLAQVLSLACFAVSCNLYYSAPRSGGGDDAGQGEGEGEGAGQGEGEGEGAGEGEGEGEGELPPHPPIPSCDAACQSLDCATDPDQPGCPPQPRDMTECRVTAYFFPYAEHHAIEYPGVGHAICKGEFGADYWWAPDLGHASALKELAIAGFEETGGLLCDASLFGGDPAWILFTYDDDAHPFTYTWFTNIPANPEDDPGGQGCPKSRDVAECLDGMCRQLSNCNRPCGDPLLSVT